MGDLGRTSQKSILDSDPFLRELLEWGKKHLVHPIEKQKSDKLNTITPFVRSLQLKFNEKPLPESYHNWPTSRFFNRTIKVDNIPASAAASWSIAIQFLVDVSGQKFYFQDHSNGYAFLTFDDHHCARKFLEIFNNKQIPGSDMVYQLSWAPFYLNLSLDEETRPSDPLASRAYKVIRSYQISAGMLHKMDEFHRRLWNKVPDECKGSCDCFAFGDRRVAQGIDDGRTAILCLVMVDPCFEESAVKFIFGQYGKCTVDVPDKEGFGMVKFEDRDCAEQAFVDLEGLLKDGNVCHLRWGIDTETSLAAEWGRKGNHPIDLERQRQKAIVKTEVDKRPRSRSGSKEKWGMKKY